MKINYIKIMVGLGIFFGMILLVSAMELTTRYNPWTGKFDYVSTGNFTGDNLTADYFLGSGSYLTDISTYNSTYDAKVSSQWVTSGSDIYYNDGDIGFGTTNPTAPLHIKNVNNEKLKFEDAAAAGNANNWMSFFSTTGRDGYFGFASSDDLLLVNQIATGKVLIGAGGNNPGQLTIDSTGKVGIGTTSPGTHGKVELKQDLSGGSDVMNLGVVDSTTQSTGHGGGIRFAGAYTGTTLTSAAVIRAEKTNSVPGDWSFGLGFYTREDGAGLVRNMVIADTGNIGIGTLTPSYPLEVRGNGSGNITIWAEGNISAGGFITRTSIFDTSKNVWDFIKDASYYKTQGKINHKKFYGYAGSFEITDYNRPIEEDYIKEECDDNFTCFNVTKTKITYPYTKVEEGVSLDAEIDLLRQAVYELKLSQNTIENELIMLRAENQLIKQELCKKDNLYLFCK